METFTRVQKLHRRAVSKMTESSSICISLAICSIECFSSCSKDLFYCAGDVHLAVFRVSKLEVEEPSNEPEAEAKVEEGADSN